MGGAEGGMGERIETIGLEGIRGTGISRVGRITGGRPRREISETETETEKNNEKEEKNNGETEVEVERTIGGTEGNLIEIEGVKMVTVWVVVVRGPHGTSSPMVMCRALSDDE